MTKTTDPTDLTAALAGCQDLEVMSAEDLRAFLLSQEIDPGEVELLVAASEGDTVALGQIRSEAMAESELGHLEGFQRREGALRKRMEGAVVTVTLCPGE